MKYLKREKIKLTNLFKTDLTGMIFGRLTVKSFHGRLPVGKQEPYKNTKPFWLCICECGTEKIIYEYSLKSGNTSSCGCFTKDRTISVGDTFQSKSSGSFIVVEVLPESKYKVRFEDGYEKIAFHSSIMKGSINNPYRPTLAGVGYMGDGKFSSKNNGKLTKEYVTWKSMISRVYNPERQKQFPTYNGCSVSDEFLNFQNFAEWFSNQPNKDKGYHLDKDLTVLGNKVYSAETCCLLPSAINGLFLGGIGRLSGKFDQKGVSFAGNKNLKKHWKASSLLGGNLKHLGYYSTKQEALDAYWDAKSKHCLEVVERFRQDLPDKVINNILAIVDSKGSILNDLTT